MKGVCSAALGIVLLTGSVVAVSAQTTTASSSRAAVRAGAVAQRLQNMVNRADQEIARRVNALNVLGVRISDMQKVSSDEKSNLSSTIQSQISAMNSLETKIAADGNSTSSLKDRHSIHHWIVPHLRPDRSAGSDRGGRRSCYNDRGRDDDHRYETPDKDFGHREFRERFGKQRHWLISTRRSRMRPRRRRRP